MYYYRYRRRRRPGPKKVKNGIKVRAKRGELGQGWLAKGWIRALEGAHSYGPFARGRTYARQGQVLSVAVERGRVAGMVQGSAKQPYHMSMDIMTPDGYREKVARLLGERPIYAANLLAGYMPEGMGAEMANRGAPLFPTGREVRVSCTCNEWSDFCKHVVAVSYILAEEFDRDPLLYMRIRGVDRNDLLNMLWPGSKPGAAPGAIPPDTGAGPPPRRLPKTYPIHTIGWGALRGMLLGGRPPEPDPDPATPGLPISELPAEFRLDAGRGDAADGSISVLGGLEPGFHIGDFGPAGAAGGAAQLPSDPSEFWGRRGSDDDSYESAPAPAEPAALIKTLGRFPMWRGEEAFIPLMEEIYSKASLTGANAYLGIRDGLDGKGSPNNAAKK